MKFTLRIGEEMRTVRVMRAGGALRLRFEDEPQIEVAVRRMADGTIELWPMADGEDAETGSAIGAPARRLRAAAAAVGQGGERQLWVDGRMLRYARHAGGAARASADSGALSASIPAVVLEILVAPGDTVEDGQKLVLLESMKMVMPIQAPHAGVIAALHCAVGDAVEPGVLLIELDRE